MTRVDYLAAGAKRRAATPIVNAVAAWMDAEAKSRSKATGKSPAAAKPAVATRGRGRKGAGSHRANAVSSSPWASGTGFGGSAETPEFNYAVCVLRRSMARWRELTPTRTVKRSSKKCSRRLTRRRRR